MRRKSLFYVVLVLLVTVIPAGCAAPPPEEGIGRVEVLGVWGGDEMASFQAMVAPWQEETGGVMEFTGTRDLMAILTTRVEAGNPPDVVILPNPGQMVELAGDGKLIALDSFLDMNRMRREYAQGWLDLGSINGRLYGIFMKAAGKGTIWYNPRVFAANGWKEPATWDDLIALSDRIVSEGGAPAYPWSVGLESGEASGWPATDWIGEILLHESGGKVYDRWLNHEIPWTDPRIKSAWEKFGRIVFTPGYVPGGAIGALATGFIDASYLPFEDPPKAAMYCLGSFTQEFIAGQYPGLVAGEDYAFFPFPAIDSRYAGAVTGGADIVVVFKDTPATRSFVNYLTSAGAQEIWVKRGGFTSVNKLVNPDAYPDALSRKAAEQLTGATIFRFDADDSMPSAVQKAFWEGTLNYLQNPDKLDSVLTDIESRAVEAYGQAGLIPE